MILAAKRAKRQSNRSRRRPEPVITTLDPIPAPAAKPRVRDRDEQGRRTWRAFTVRIPVELYERLLAEAVSEERSVAAQTHVNLEKCYAASVPDR